MENENENIENIDNSDPGQPDPMDIAMFYTKGDEEKSQSMISGNYNDLYVIKLSFTTAMVNCACMIFFNHIFSKFIDMYGIVSQSYDVRSLETKINWKEFETGISKILDTGGHDTRSLFHLFEKIRENFNIYFCNNLINLIELINNADNKSNYIETINSLFIKNIFNNVGMEIIDLKIDYESSSSLEMELYSKSSIKLTPGQLSGDKDDEEQNMDEIAPIEDSDDEKRTLEAKDAKLILNGDIILSPIKGMHISGLVVNDEIKIVINDDNPKAPLIARAFNAYDKGKMLPITGKIVSFRHKPQGGYKIFVEIAEGIFIRVDEKEENIKVELYASAPDRASADVEGVSKYVDKHIKAERKKNTEVNKTKKKDAPESNIALIIAVVVLAIFIISFIIIIVL